MLTREATCRCVFAEHCFSLAVTPNVQPAAHLTQGYNPHLTEWRLGTQCRCNVPWALPRCFSGLGQAQCYWELPWVCVPPRWGKARRLSLPWGMGWVGCSFIRAKWPNKTLLLLFFWLHTNISGRKDSHSVSNRLRYIAGGKHACLIINADFYLFIYLFLMDIWLPMQESLHLK